MPYNTKAILTDLNGKPIPQFFDPVADAYAPLNADELYEALETQLAAILAKLIAAPATEATLAAVKAAVELDSRGLFVNRPTAAAGQFKTYWSVDTGDISVSDGTTWKTIGVI